jgi:hypothetical protein
MNSPARPAATALPPSELVERMLHTAEALAGVVGRETAFLEANEPLRIDELQEEKSRLANEYALDVQAIVLRKELIDRAPSEKIGRLKAAMTRLEQALQANQRALTASKSVSERILKSIADTLSEHKTPTLGYGRNAAPARPQAARVPAAIALDARV